jgi:hypothetical protein
MTMTDQPEGLTREELDVLKAGILALAGLPADTVPPDLGPTEPFHLPPWPPHMAGCWYERGVGWGRYGPDGRETVPAEVIADAGLPAAVLTAIATLRTAAYWLPDPERDMLREAADHAEKSWDGGCCPICEETFCDGGCPLEDVRTEMYRREEAAKVTDAHAGCDGRHPLIRHDGSVIYLYDLVTHPDCPHQPWATLPSIPEPVVPAEVIEALALGARRLLDIELAMASRPSPFTFRAPEREPSPACYAASWGMVHSRPSCRCSR